MSRRVLIVTPYFPPANGADSHRVRVTIPFFQEFGWKPEVLAVNPEALAVPKDQWLLNGIPSNIPVHHCSAISLNWSWVPGLGTIDLRAGISIKRMGDNLLQSGQFDLVYFSTTTFSFTMCGQRWKRKFGVPYVVDYQDPWVTDYYAKHPEVTPPGGRFKYSIVNRIARQREPAVINACDGITSVSPAYPEDLATLSLIHI